MRNLINYVKMDNRQLLMEIIELPFHVKTRFEFRCSLCVICERMAVSPPGGVLLNKVRRVTVVKSRK